MLLRLRNGTRRAANEILPLVTLDPKVLGKIRNVGEDCDKRAPGTSTIEAFAKCPVKMRHERHNHPRLRFLPMALEQADSGAMITSDYELQHLHELRAAQSPAGPQHGVIEVLNSNARMFLQDIQFVEKLLEICEAN